MEFLFLITIVLQVIAESMPISSSGHLMLLHSWLETIGFNGQSLDNHVPHVPIDTFIPVPNILIFIIFFIVHWGHWTKQAFNAFFRSIYTPSTTYRLRSLYLHIIGCVVVSGLCSFIEYILIPGFLVKTMPGMQYILLLGFVITAGLLFSLIILNKRGYTEYRSISIGNAVIIGLIQGLALLPGISRMASTYVVGRWLGLKPVRSFQYSLLIGVPVMIGGFVIDCLSLWSVLDFSILYSPIVLFGTVAASIISWFVLGMTYRMVVGQTLWKYGIYMVVPVGISLLLMIR